MNKQYEEKMKSLVNALIVKKDITRAETKDLAVLAVKTMNSVDESDKSHSKLIHSYIKQWGIATYFVSALTLEELQEVFPIDALVGTQAYEKSIMLVDFYKDRENIGVDRVGVLFDLYHNKEIKKFGALRRQLESEIPKKQMFEMVHDTNTVSINDLVQMNEDEREAWYDGLIKASCELQSKTVNEIAEIFHIEDQYDGTPAYFKSLRWLNENDGEKLDLKNFNAFLSEYANDELHEFGIRRFFVNEVLIESRTIKGKIVNFIDTIKDKLTFVH
ncbi:MAG: hypothetical protein K0S80_1099 [Neobacillus sp.]|nr:hypothetical protein [Neobacillus sp.]